MTKKRSQKKKTSAPASRPKKKAKWPDEREVLFRPDRYKYIKSNKDRREGQGLCVFCQAFEAGPSAESLVVFETPLARVVLNRFPYNPGHLMVLPLRHEGDFLKLTIQEHEEIFRLVRVAVSVLKRAFEVGEFNIGINLGRGAGAGIPEHLHVHVLPRWPGDSNFFPVIANTKAIPMDLDSSYKLLAPLFAESGRAGI